VAERDSIIRILRGSENPCFIELGAYNGADSLLMCGAARIVKGLAVEADLENFRQLRLPIAIEYGAISDHDGFCDFWICKDPANGRGSGSIREPTGHLVRHGVPYTFEKVQIHCFTLDSIAAKHGFDHVDVLWVDLQGGEKDMIASGQKTLAMTRYMLIESEYAEELYKEQAMRPELLSLLPDWETIEDFDWNLLMRNKKLT
jgi:FkbM family methyltransferase